LEDTIRKAVIGIYSTAICLSKVSTNKVSVVRWTTVYENRAYWV